jgi:transposase
MKTAIEHPALRESRHDIAQFDRHRDRFDRRTQVNRLDRINMPGSEIAARLGVTERTVERDRQRNRAEGVPQRPRLYNPELADDQRVAELEAATDLALRLAAVLRDEDVTIVWGALSRLDRRKLQELAVIALAAIPVDHTPTQLLGWVTELGIEAGA